MNKKVDDKLTPLRVISNFNDGKLTLENANELLILIFKNSKIYNERLETIEYLGSIITKNNRNFKFLENILISDTDPFIRKEVASVIAENFPDQAAHSFRWELKNEKSPIVIKSILDIIINDKKNPLHKLQAEANRWLSEFGNLLNITPKEAYFILDIESIFSLYDKSNTLNNDTFKFYKELEKLNTKTKWFSIKNRHIQSLKFNIYKWTFLRNSLALMKSFNKYRDLDLLLSLLRQMDLDVKKFNRIPLSIGNLKHLEFLDLSENNLKVLPPSIQHLNPLKQLDLSYNNITIFPHTLLSLDNLEILDLRFNNLSEVPTEIDQLINLQKLYLKGNSIRNISNNLRKFLESLKIDIEI
ncbi:MAG: hypothetical protein GF317_03110 [Candidatus Lokiarchaeota archaeon]|nr:hypothetical protein [Candidatus Lokiarchaeota archaeon]MBD3198897.1 hypothetical protein [Candidatus Lokiarchaeota archaeon]